MQIAVAVALMSSAGCSLLFADGAEPDASVNDAAVPDAPVPVDNCAAAVVADEPFNEPLAPRWDLESGNGEIRIDGGELILAPENTDISSVKLTSSAAYPFLDQILTVELGDLELRQSVQLRIGLLDAGGRHYGFVREVGQLVTRNELEQLGSLSTAAGGDDRFLRIRIHAGWVVFEISPDGGRWRVMTTTFNGLQGDAQVEIELFQPEMVPTLPIEAAIKGLSISCPPAPNGQWCAAGELEMAFDQPLADLGLNDFGAVGAEAKIEGAVLELRFLPVAADLARFAGVVSKNRYSVVDSPLAAEVASLDLGVDGKTRFSAVFSIGNAVELEIHKDKLNVIKTFGTVEATLASLNYDSSLHRFLAIAGEEASGAYSVRFLASSDGITFSPSPKRQSSFRCPLSRFS